MADFLSDPQTKAPLTISIEGEWGSGKTSFMKQLEKALQRRADKAGDRARTVWFSPWRHDCEDALWAAFALTFVDGLRKTVGWGRRLWGDAWLFIRRFKWSSGWLDALRILVTMAALLVLTFALPYLYWKLGDTWLAIAKSLLDGDPAAKNLVDYLVKPTGALALLALMFTAWKKLASLVGNPFKVNLKQHVKAPNYEDKVSFVEKFHGDFHKMIGAYCGTGNKVFIFIDDLDRCAVPRAADLMQALNLMISENPQVVFIIGMDRRKVAAGLAVKFRHVTPYLYDGVSDADKLGRSHSMRGLRFGWDYIEKFVQLPFRLPQPASIDLKRFVEALAQQPEASGPSSPSHRDCLGLFGVKSWGLSKER